MKNWIALLFVAAACLNAQPSAKDAAAANAIQKTLTDAASAGTPVSATINVAENVNIEAVMLPEKIARRVFGKEVSQNYAVIEVNISNRSNDAGLIVQSLFIDLQNWGLAGPMSAALSTGGASSRPYQVQGSPLEVSSVEYRIVRGEMLDQQPWTRRNEVLRAIQVMGSLGTAFAFPFTKDVTTGIGAWNGAFVPGFEALFPDGTQAQLDRVSDYGFRNNKVIPQQAADILIAFFPVKRFLTPSSQQVFLKDPALFFNPILVVIDPKTRPLLYPILSPAYGGKAKADKATKKSINAACGNLLQEFAVASADAAFATVSYQQDLDNITAANAAITQDNALIAQDKDNPSEDHLRALQTDKSALADATVKSGKDKEFLHSAWLPLTVDPLYNMLGALSLNNVHVAVSGIMATDIDNVPATIASVTCTNDDQPATVWGSAGDRTCAIHGSFLTDGTPVIAEATNLGLTVGAVTAGSTDAVLNIKLSLKKPVRGETVLTFQVTKKNKQGNTVESMKFLYTVPDYPAPSIAGVAVKEATVTVTGEGFNGTTTNPLAVAAHAVTPSGVADQKIEKPTVTPTQIQFDDNSFPGACWQVQVKVGSVQAPASTEKPPKDQFASVPAPEIKTATLSGTKLTVAGGEFVDLTGCGGSLVTFEILSDATGAKAQAISKATLSADGKQATFDAPTPAQGEKWNEVHALVDGKQRATIKIK